MDREKYNLKIALDLDTETTMGDLRTFVKMLEELPDDMSIFDWDTRSNNIMLIGYIAPDDQ